MEGRERDKLIRTKEDGNKMAIGRIDFDTKGSLGWGPGPPGGSAELVK